VTVLCKVVGMIKSKIDAISQFEGWSWSKSQQTVKTEVLRNRYIGK
jgi:hypothetical protein